MAGLAELPLALLSFLWRITSFTTIRTYHGHDASWRSCTLTSAVMAHGGTWTTWVLAALYFASTAATRPRLTWTLVSAPILIAVVVVMVFLTYTARGDAYKPGELFLGAPLLPGLPSASNLLVVVGIVADGLLLALKSGWIT
jgi:hypothetical protein